MSGGGIENQVRQVAHACRLSVGHVKDIQLATNESSSAFNPQDINEMRGWLINLGWN